MCVAVLVVPYFVVERLGVELEGQAEADVEVGRFILVGLGEGHAVGVVPQVVVELGVLGRRCESVEVGHDAVEVGRGAYAVAEAEPLAHADGVAGVEAGGDVV